MEKPSSVLTLQVYTVSVLHIETTRYWSHAVSQKQHIYILNIADYKIAIQNNLNIITICIHIYLQTSNICFTSLKKLPIATPKAHVVKQSRY